VDAVLLDEFHSSGGKIEIREFHAPSELGHLNEKVVINCPGYAAKDPGVIKGIREGLR